MAFRQYSDAGNTATRRKSMQMDVQQRCSCGVHCINHRLLDTIFVGEPFGLPKIDDQVTARKGLTIDSDEVILAVRIPFGNRNRDGPRRSARFQRSCSIDRRHTEFESSHPGTYPSKGVDTKARQNFGALAQEESGGRRFNSAARRFVPRDSEQRKYRAVSPPRKIFVPIDEKILTSSTALGARVAAQPRWTRGATGPRNRG